MAPWCHVQSAKVVRRPHPLLEVRTPIAIAIWGINEKLRRYFFFRWLKGDGEGFWSLYQQPETATKWGQITSCPAL